MSATRYGFWLALALAWVTGCSGPEVKQISGRVLLDGDPLADACVVLFPRDNLHLGMFVCPKNDDDGRFLISPCPERGEGFAGTFLVTVSESKRPDLLSLAPPRIPRRYTNKDWTPLVAEVVPGINELSEFALTSDPREKEEHRQRVQAFILSLERKDRTHP